MASGRRPRRHLTENDRELANGAVALGVVALVAIVVLYWIAAGPVPGAR